MNYSKIPLILFGLSFFLYFNNTHAQEVIIPVSISQQQIEEIELLDSQILVLHLQKERLERAQLTGTSLQQLNCDEMTHHLEQHKLFAELNADIAKKEFNRVKKKGMEGNALSVKEYSARVFSLNRQISELVVENQRLKCLRKNMVSRWESVNLADVESQKEVFRRELSMDNEVLKQQLDVLESLRKTNMEKSYLHYGKEQFQILAEVERIKYEKAMVSIELTENSLREWQLKAGGTKKFGKQIQQTQKSLSELKQQAFATKLNYLGVFNQIKTNPKWQDDLSAFQFLEVFEKGDKSELPEALIKQSPSYLKLIDMIDFQVIENEYLFEKKFRIEEHNFLIKHQKTGEIEWFCNDKMLSKEDFLLSSTTELAKEISNFPKEEHRRIWYYFEGLIE